ncbi:polysaccharide deacetylase family protein [Streptomyces sp. BE303]|uniref:polysaccharide deacetylase family protein n=1 Tax=Streptomyces sp. BE303 TaxID=3002528 RepID=UPI002E7716A3|nr:polysaccharide deacetylase family protein [Streptomyces sp. BE303]MED7953868.1 polysaccharide deacetylase family protein [Streptomyces sp. BE303]
MHRLRATLTTFRASLLATLATLATLGAAVAAPAPPTLLGQEVRRLPVEERVVALTFNAAWDETGLAAVLATLRDRSAPATFFPTGQYAEQHPGAVRAVAAAGHGLGNHSYSHPHFTGLRPDRARAEVLRADAAIRAAAGAEPLPFFRFPYSETTPEAIARVNALGFADLEFTTDTNGYLGVSGGMTISRVVERAMAALTPGALLQLHVGSAEDAPAADRRCLDAEALPLIIDAVRSHGYRILDLRELLGDG